MKAEIISVGTELLLGQIIDKDAPYLYRKLAELGIDVHYQSTLGDNPTRLVGAIEAALSRSDIVITAGGLGPTVDDITLYSMGSVTSRALVYEKKIEKYILRFFEKRKRKVEKDALRQANIPRGARWFENKLGTAPGILVEHGEKILIALPGPPRELIPLFENSIIPFLKKKRLVGNRTIKTKTIKIAGLLEVEVNKLVKDLLSMGPKTTMGIYAHLGETHLKITSKAKNEKAALREIKKAENKLRKRLSKYIYGVDDETLEFAVGKTLAAKRKTLAIAESCTGGLIADRITNISGSSDYFKMGIVAYSNEAKINLLGVSEENLKKYGAVSKQVALEMAKGVKNISGATISIGVTGIAGPKGGTSKKPVGLVFIAVITNKTYIIKEHRFKGSRREIKLQTSTAALNLLRGIL